MLLSLLAPQPIWISGTILVGLMTLLAMIAPIIVRRRVGLEGLRANNEVAGFKFATVGVLYAVLLAFAVIIAWEKFSEAESAAAKEAGAVATLYRLSLGIEGEPGAALRSALTRYAGTVMAEDWPAMERGRGSLAVTRALDEAYAALLTFRPSDGRGNAVMAEALDQLDNVTQARRLRLVLAPGVVPRVLWFILSSGAILTLVFTLFFGTQNLRAQSLMTGILAFLIFSGLLVITAIDRPFAGAVKVEPHALATVLDDFAGAERR
ncbi:bestrophin-like domain [Methylobacterium haplocladii]|uniref:DUF4239 domain-containing protein n=1 Tax=Methylobacterium haplocladii TaxID=1176176 RepID=A0A512IJQ1_9HYPH|nr:DUF4239 domain-containing protein [Methylobacterium haplocladii]GEO97943.1 hypothetical protein MHA02_03310 [Methylobacterium haplocladii]GJD85990.1 hypothetical protein HPGCJGGD_3885 [Methylobacterium haplocladii]GLS58710.1 hypothetical protein GCM10007887_13740 [Methylobacterium haplocladii]